jgi:hypothetical protein
MEDQMATQDLDIKLELDHYATFASAPVRLTATLTKISGKLTDDEIAQAQVTFEASESPKPVIQMRDGKVVIATFAPTNQNLPKIITITARLNAGTIAKSDSQELSVVKQPNRNMTVSGFPAQMQEGGLIRLETSLGTEDSAGELTSDILQKYNLFVDWTGPTPGSVLPDNINRLKATFDTTGFAPGIYPIEAQLVDRNHIPLPIKDSTKDPALKGSTESEVVLRPLSRGDVLPVTLRRTSASRTKDQVLWSLIRDRTTALSFMGGGYKTFIDRVLCDPTTATNPLVSQRLAGKVGELGINAYGMAAYDLLKTATEVFLLIECGVAIDSSFAGPGYDPDSEAARLGERISVTELRNRLHGYFQSGRLPYLDRVISAAFPDTTTKVDSIFCPGALSSRVSAPCLLELIWSYWHEEGMLVQTMNAISRRFQNVRGPGDRDPLAHLEIDPLRPLNNLLWGYVQDEQNLLTVKRRAYEYDHHYGLATYGKAVPPLRPADSRSKFLEGFHNLLHGASVFYKEDNDTTVIADGFPLLNALREVHLLLAQGAHNQFGDLPWTARAEMLMQQWLLAQPQMREFLQSRPMVPYKEPWMGQVDTMKSLQGWSDVTVTHFRDLGAYGEQILLSVRYGDWIDINEEDSAKNWARYWRAEIQSYIHAYRIVTGIDLSNPDTVDYTMPAVHLQKRLVMQRAR